MNRVYSLHGSMELTMSQLFILPEKELINVKMDSQISPESSPGRRR
jgi:hypothetical protein